LEAVARGSISIGQHQAQKMSYTASVDFLTELEICLAAQKIHPTRESLRQQPNVEVEVGKILMNCPAFELRQQIFSDRKNNGFEQQS
jgi:hypothetical protein